MSGINVDWEIQNLNAEIKDIKKALDKKCLTLYGNGQEGLTSKIHSLEERVKNVKDDNKEINNKLDWIVKQVYLLGAVIVVISMLLKIIPVSDITKLF